MPGRLLASAIALVCITLPPIAGQAQTSRESSPAVSQADRAAVVLAIEDEIYDWGCQDEFEFVGDMKTPGRHELRVYINPQLANGSGEIIYKLMPFGEVRRTFRIGKSGLAYLEDTPKQGFGPERSNSRTVYMDDDELLRDKEQWIKTSFVIDEHPDQKRLGEARSRQHRRLGEMDYGPYKGCPV